MDSLKTNQLKLRAEDRNSHTESSVEHPEAEEAEGLYSRFSNVALDGTVRKLDANEEMSFREMPPFGTVKKDSNSSRQET